MKKKTQGGHKIYLKSHRQNLNPNFKPISLLTSKHLFLLDGHSENKFSHLEVSQLSLASK